MNTQEHFNSITTLMETIYTKKNHDYGDSFTRSLNKYGIVASIVRMEDKKNRIESLIKRKQMVNDESIIDTLTDLANYAIMARMWLEGREGVAKPCDESQGTGAEKSEGTVATDF